MIKAPHQPHSEEPELPTTTPGHSIHSFDEPTSSPQEVSGAPAVSVSSSSSHQVGVGDVLDEIVDNKRAELKKSNAFRDMLDSRDLSIICELKRKSPTVPDGFNVDVDDVFSDYAKVADAISVVTDKQYFGGNYELVTQARKTGLPVLRKDFIIDPLQVAEVATDALLLIARIVPEEQLQNLVDLCLLINIEPVVEIHDAEDLAKALKTSANVIAVNTRNLQTQTIDQTSAYDLLDAVPGEYTKLLFSGIKSHDDVAQAVSHGVKAVLVGTSILESENRVEFVKKLRGGGDE